MHSSSRAKLLAAVLGTSLAGCGHLPSPGDVIGRAVGSAAGSAADTAGNRVGSEVGNQVGSAASARVGAHLSPMMMQFYMQFVFSMAFSQGGYAVNEVAYVPGQWTRWSVPNKGAKGEDPKETILERAYLFDDADGNAWWKVKYILDPGKPDTSTLIVEALFDRKSSTLLRMRAKMPNETEGKEVPVTEATYYVPPQKLTKQSIQGATKGVVSVTVPAGTYSARHVVFSDAAGGSAEWYLTQKVPGGSVKFVHVGPKQAGEERTDAQHYAMDLVTFGKDAKSELGVTR